MPRAVNVLLMVGAVGFITAVTERGLFTRQKGGFYHDGRFPTLEAVVNHYDDHLKLKLTAEQKRELVEYLKSL